MALAFYNRFAPGYSMRGAQGMGRFYCPSEVVSILWADTICDLIDRVQKVAASFRKPGDTSDGNEAAVG